MLASCLWFDSSIDDYLQLLCGGKVKEIVCLSERPLSAASFQRVEYVAVLVPVTCAISTMLDIAGSQGTSSQMHML